MVKKEKIKKPAKIIKEKKVKKEEKIVKPKKSAEESVVAKEPVILSEENNELKSTRYFEGIGRRKTSVARVRLFTQGEKAFLVNNKPYQEYFTTFELQQTANASLRKMKSFDRFKVECKVKGGGIHSQAEAVRHGLARVLVDFNPDFRKRLRRSGFLTRDPRARERKKFGLKRARRAPQWKKR